MTNVFVRIDTSRDVAGYGCAAPERSVTGEEPAEVLRALNDTAGPALVGSDPLRHAMLLERLKKPAEKLSAMAFRLIQEIF